MTASFIKNIDEIVEVGSEEQQPQETPQATPAATETTTQPQATPTPAAEPISPKLTAELARASSKFFVKMIDGSQRLLFTAITNKKLKNRLEIIAGDDYEFKVQMAMQKLDADEENKENGTPTKHEYNKEEKMLLGNVVKFEAFIDDLPFTDDEKEELIECLTIIAKAKGGALPPEYIAAGTIAMSMINRGVKLYGL